MSHAHEKTLLARFGFNDPDRKEPLHDLACIYLSRPEAAEKIALLPGEKTLQKWRSAAFINAGHKKEGITFKAVFERMILDRHFTVGFVDLSLSFRITENRDGEYKESVRWGEWRSVTGKHSAEFHWSAFIEVKIQRFGVGDLIRQINFYRRYDEEVNCRDDHRWIVASPHRLSADERSALLTAEIIPIRLGPAFLQWVEERKQQPAHDPSVEL